MKWIYLDMEVVNPRIPTIAAFVVILVMEAVSLAQATWISAALYEGTPKGILCSAVPSHSSEVPLLTGELVLELLSTLETQTSFTWTTTSA